MATQHPTPSMLASADSLLARRHLWIRGRRKSDSRAIYVFPSSSKPKQAWYCAIDGSACNCPGQWFYGQCAHRIAARRDFEQARATADRPRKGYADLFPENDDIF